MRVAVIGSRGLCVENLGDYLPADTTEIVSGGARGVDTSARNYALQHGLKLTEYLPEYSKYGRSAPLKRNITIIENADLVLAFWDGKIQRHQVRNRQLQKKKYPGGGTCPHREIAVVICHSFRFLRYRREKLANTLS